MIEQREFMSETFHTLAQPITALRATIELGLLKPTAEPPTQLLESCLQLIDRLMHDLSVFRELAALDEAPPTTPCDGGVLLESCVTEMAIVAEAGAIPIHLKTEHAMIQCNAQMFQRALFLLLDEMIASASISDSISISLCSGADGVQLSFYPGTAQGQRQKLCSKLMHFAGATNIRLTSESTFITFPGIP